MSLGKAENRDEEFPVSKTLIALFLILVVGSSLVEVLNLFSRAPAFGGGGDGGAADGAGGAGP